ncbi:MAG: RelA/SpoT family protein, partial [Filifactor alocis]|nr:RelA/SpoT family protein [Filifactor alocis]
MEKIIRTPEKEDIDVQALYEELEEKVMSYHRVEEDIAMIRKAFEVAEEAHRPQKRASGEPYITHPLHVAMILADLKLDRDTIVAALLHDVVEDTGVKRSDIEAWFGEDIAFLVDGVTKIADLPKDLTKKQIKQESFLKLIFATADDIRVIVIKLADRLHNMRTMGFQAFEKQERISKETLEIYAPIAQRLGISIISTELEDLSFSYLKPEAYRNIFEQVQKNDYKGKLLSDMNSVKKILEEGGIEHELSYHQKHLFSIHRKMLNRHKSLEELYGIGVIKVIVESEKDCYLALWKLHSHYKILPGRIKDYISLPREDMYQALHTTLISKNGGQFKVRIKTREMERFSKFGVLGHWEYAISGGEVRNVSHAQGKASFWLQRILQWQEDAKNTAELMDLVKDDFDLFLEKICCFTPDTEAKHLPKGATVLDFAYAIHSEVGNKAIGAIIGGKRKDLDAVLKDGEVVHILRKEESPGPQAYWLDFAKTANARSNIRKALKIQQGKDH